MKDLLAQQLEAFVKTLKAKRPEWDLIGDASVTAQQAGLEMFAELLLDAYNAPQQHAVANVQKVLRLQWPALELAMQAARDLGWRYQWHVPTKWTLRTEARLYNRRGLASEFTVDVRLFARPPDEQRKRRGSGDLFDLYLSWPSDVPLTVPALQKRLKQVEFARAAGRPRQLAPESSFDYLWAFGPVGVRDVLEEAEEGGWHPGQTYELGLLCSSNQKCPYTWRSMVALYEHAPFWFACLHDVVGQTAKIAGG